MNTKGVRATVYAGMILLFLILPVVYPSPFFLHVLIMFFLYSLLSESWNIIGGYAGQLSFGHALYFGMAAYVSTFLFVKFGLTPWLGLLVAIPVVSMAGLLTGLPFFRLKGHYFAIGTIGLTEAIATLVNEWELVGGAVGVYIPMLEPSLANFQWKSRVPYYYIIFGFLILSMVIVYRIERSKLGYYLRAIKMNEAAAVSLGINPLKAKEIAMAISCSIAALGGVFYAQYTLYIHAETVMALPISVDMAVIPLVGGAGTLFGPIIGAAILIPLAEGLRVYLGKAGTLHLAIFGVIVMLVAIFQPSGIIIYLRHLFKKK
jgi:branched-chain amino acid transport system permease protein